MSKRMPIQLLIFVLIALFAASCASDDYGAQRAEAARNATSDDAVVLGFVWQFADQADLLPYGVDMAVEEINAAGGVLSGREIQLLKKDDFASVREGRLIAQEFAENPKVAAVIGHAYSYISVPAAPIYEFSDLLMLSPAATSPDLTGKGFSYIFRNLASDVEVGRQLAVYAAAQGYKRMMILNADDSNGRQLANVFENEADKRDIYIVDRRSYQNARNFNNIISLWIDPATENQRSFDAIFVAGLNPDAAQFVLRARETWPGVPILGSDGMDTDDLWNIAGEDANGVVVVSHYHPDNPREAQQIFIEKFRARYDMEPDTWAALGYDAVYLLAYAMNQAGTTEPDKLQEAMHNVENWQGVTGPHTYNAAGDVIGKPVILKQMQDGTFEFLAVVAFDEDYVEESADEEPEVEVTVEAE